MKKILFLLAVSLILCLGNISYADTAAATSDTTSTLIEQLKDSIVNDVTNTVTTSVNNAKLTAYKAQLEVKKKELEELEKSNTFVIVKIFRRISINNKIAQLEAQIAQIENANK